MIPNVVRGTRVGGLLRYLYGPGKREEHRDPHLVAAWDGAGPLHRLEPPAGPVGKRDFRRLVDLLEQPVRNGRNPPRKPVWHCSIRTHPSDRWLADAQWAHIAGEVMAQVGLAQHGDARAVRWVAIRHGPDHIHIVATLVRQDRRTEYARNDRWKAQAACRDIEERYGLHRVGPADRTSHRRPKAAELNKGERTGRVEPARDRLRREVRFAAAAAASAEEFFTLLRGAGVLVEPRLSAINPGQVTGYKVALADHAAGDGTPIWYGGGKLAPDLSLPRLMARWADIAAVPGRPDTAAGLYEQAAEQVDAAAADIRRLATDAPGGASAAGYAAADTLTVTARHAEGTRRGPLHEAAEALDRATRLPHGRFPARTPRAQQLRAVSRLLAVAGRLADDKALFAMLRLIVNLSLMAEALAELRDTQRRIHQARAARTAARLLRAAAHAPARPVPATTQPEPAPLTGAPTTPRTPRRTTQRRQQHPTARPNR